MSKTLLIVNARIVNEGRIDEGDLLISNGRIAKIDAEISAGSHRVINADGQYLLPGMIDDQVHFREPGLTHKGDFATESRAAVAGGITSFMEMPNTSPLTTNAEALEDKYGRAAGRSRANYAFYLGATNNNLEDIKSLDPKKACGIKVFMGASTGDMLVDDIDALEGIFAHAPTLVATHCEDTPTIESNLAEARKKFGDELTIDLHPQIRSREACLLSSSLAVDLARRHGTNLHVLHLTTADELKLFECGDVMNKKITAEACVHHLLFSESDYAQHGNFIKCNPAIKSETDRVALLQALRDNQIDIIATDHAPHTLEEKETSYLRAAAGLPLVQHALPCALEHVATGALDLTDVVAKTAHNPAVRFRVKDRGYIREGYWADLTLVELNANQMVRRADLLYRCGWSPFEGKTLNARVATTIVSGAVAYENGRVIEDDGAQRLEFDR